MFTLKTATGEVRKPRALVYMLDAARADVLEAVNHPLWQKLKNNQWAKGYRSAWSVTAEIEPYAETNSGPNHVTIATGMLFRSHHVAYNDTIWSFNDATTPTWLERLGRKFPEMRTVFAFDWLPDLAMMAEHGRHSVVCGTDEKNNEAVAALLRRTDAPEAVMVYDDEPDYRGHEYAFYPFSDEYLRAAENCMTRLGKLLDVIEARPAFAEEDWLIVVCSDHGGMGFRHGMSGGQASTVPLLYCGRNIPAGVLAGRPGTVDIAAQLLRHFGLNDEVAELDGQASLEITPAQSPRSFADGLLYDLSVVNGNLVNTAAGALPATPHGEGVIGDVAIDLARGFVTLDGLKDHAGSELTFALKFKGDFPKTELPQVIFGNKDCTAPTTPGFALMAERGVSWPLTRGKNKISFHAGCKNAPRTYLVPKSDRMELSDVLVGDGEETILAVSIDPKGMVTVYQHSLESDQRYWFCNDAAGIRPVSQLPWNLGQDGTGRYKQGSELCVSSFRFWDRALKLDELRKM